MIETATDMDKINDLLNDLVKQDTIVHNIFRPKQKIDEFRSSDYLQVSKTVPRFVDNSKKCDIQAMLTEYERIDNHCNRIGSQYNEELQEEMSNYRRGEEATMEFLSHPSTEPRLRVMRDCSNLRVLLSNIAADNIEENCGCKINRSMRPASTVDVSYLGDGDGD